MLEVVDLAVSFKTEWNKTPICVLDGLSFTLEPGKRLAIVGESGSGKSVAVKAILGLLPKQATIEGRIIYSASKDNPIDLIHCKEQEWRKIRGAQMAMIFQEPMSALNPVLTCGFQLFEVLKLHLKLNGQALKEAAKKVLNEVQLLDVDRVLKAYPHQLSGGQRQRLMIAMALAANPQYLIADEPTTALDVQVQDEILKLLHSVSERRRMGLIFISHDLGTVENLCEQVLVLYKGKCVEFGEVKEVFENPKHVYTKALLKSRPKVGLNLKKLPVLQDFFEEKDGVLLEKPEPALSYNHEGDAKLFERPLIKIKELSFAYTLFDLWGNAVSKTKVIDQLNLNIYEGECLVLLGQSGSGKSTLGKSILQLSDFEGEISYRLNDVDEKTFNNRKERARFMQLIFQDPFAALNPHLKIKEVFTQVLKAHQLAKGKELARCRELIELVNLDASGLEKYPHEFSGGQRQRICIARALAAEPKFLVCDESVSALDVSVQAQILNLLTNLKEQLGLTYLFITHDLKVAWHMANHIMVLKDGKVEEYGSKAQVFNYPTSAYTQTLLKLM